MAAPGRKAAAKRTLKGLARGRIYRIIPATPAADDSTAASITCFSHALTGLCDCYRWQQAANEAAQAVEAAEKQELAYDIARAGDALSEIADREWNVLGL